MKRQYSTPKIVIENAANTNIYTANTKANTANTNTNTKLFPGRFSDSWVKIEEI